MQNTLHSLKSVMVADLTLRGGFNLSRPNPGRIKKIKLNFYFHTSLQCLKRFFEGLKG